MDKKGIVLKVAGKHYTILTEDNKIVTCTLSGKLRLKDFQNTNPIVVGDYVGYEVNSDNTGVINHLFDRKNYLIRKSVKLSNPYQIIAANIDYVYIIFTLIDPIGKLEFLDRILVTCEAYRLQARIILNKIDLYDKIKDSIIEFEEIYKKAGYKVIKTSIYMPETIEYLKELLKDKINLLVGFSGVGKSSLIKTLIPNINIKILEISRYHRQGQHATTFSEMYLLPFGGFIIDTPGIRSFGFYDIKKNELFHFFPEILKAAKNCKYHNCTHTTEPDCAVIKAVENNEISPFRFRNYLSMYYDEEKKYR